MPLLPQSVYHAWWNGGIAQPVCSRVRLLVTVSCPPPIPPAPQPAQRLLAVGKHPARRKPPNPRLISLYPAGKRVASSVTRSHGLLLVATKNCGNAPDCFGVQINSEMRRSLQTEDCSEKLGNQKPLSESARTMLKSAEFLGREATRRLSGKAGDTARTIGKVS